MSASSRHRGARCHRVRAALRLASSVSVLVVVAAWVVGCGDPQPPVAVGDIPELTVYVDSTESVDIDGYFSDPDGDVLTYAAIVSDDGVATASVSESVVAVSGVSAGTDTVRVWATDPDGLSAMQVFAVTVRLTDRQVLEILYDELGGDNWRDNTGWKTDAPLDEWYGVRVNADDRVDSLTLWDQSLTGAIPPELGDLSNLEHLSLGSNQLTGGIPSELGGLSNLRDLWLYDNSLTGEIPPEVGDLSNLEDLHLGDNSLTGEIPPELGDLSNLEDLHLYANSLTGEIPSELGDLSNLAALYLHDNLLTGEIPTELSDLSNLEGLGLRSNRLTGEIPSELGDLSNLRDLLLHDNSLTGEIPPELGDLSSLEHLLLHNNSLTGEIPPDFLNLSALWWFYWNDNDGLCAPNTPEFDEWLDGLGQWIGARCD